MKALYGAMVGILFGCLFILSACGSVDRHVPLPYAVTFDVAADVNPDIRGRPSPIVLKVFQLKSASAFESAEFFALQDKPDNALGAQLLSVDRMILRPGEVRTIRYTGNAEARAIGIVAEYRSLETNRWRLTLALPEGKQPSALRFWQGSPREAKFAIAVRNGGIDRSSDARGAQ